MVSALSFPMVLYAIHTKNMANEEKEKGRRERDCCAPNARRIVTIGFADNGGGQNYKAIASPHWLLCARVHVPSTALHVPQTVT